MSNEAQRQGSQGIGASATAYAPASIGNLAVGFDVAGQALEAPGDRVTVATSPTPGVVITSVTGCVTELPARAEDNTAGAALLAMIAELSLPFGFRVSLDKGIPLGSGMGGSAASAVGAVVAASALLPDPFPTETLIRWAAAGEAVASGAPHADNVAPCLLGGIVLVGGAADPWVKPIPSPTGLVAVVAHPRHRLDTAHSRSVLPKQISLADFVDQSGRLARFVAACFTDDHPAIGAAMRDVVAEPARAALIPGFEAVRQAAARAGALACSISGGGPSVFAWCPSGSGALVAEAMVSAFRGAGYAAEATISSLEAPGARIIDRQPASGGA